MTEQKKLVRWIYDNVSFFGGITGVVAIITAIIKWIQEYNFSLLEIILLAVVIICSLAIVIYQYWIRHSYKSIYYPRSFIRSSYNFITEKKKISYILNDKNELNYKREWTIRCVGNKLDEILDKYIWTGKGVKFAIQGISGIKSVTLEDRVGIWEYFRITLNNTIKKRVNHNDSIYLANNTKLR